MHMIGIILLIWNLENLKNSIADTISRNTGNKDIEILFSEIVEMRNRIIHGFRITSKQGEQILATKISKKRMEIFNLK